MQALGHARPHRLVVLAEVLNTTDTFNQITERTGASFDAIQSLMEAAVAAGIRFPRREARLKKGQPVWRMTANYFQEPAALDTPVGARRSAA